jgi:hypothetical protein
MNEIRLGLVIGVFFFDGVIGVFYEL